MGIPRFSKCSKAVPLLVAIPLAIPAGATAQVEAHQAPTVESTRCKQAQEWSCFPRRQLVLRGHELEEVASVAFTGRRGGRDDRAATVDYARGRRVVVTVPSGARSGPLRLRTAGAVIRTSASVRIRKAPRSPGDERSAKQAPANGAPARETFPIRGKHDLGQTATNNFGGARGHKGQDMFAACGTRLVATTSGAVQAKGYHSAAGHYLVLQDETGRSHVYMHMQAAAAVNTGDRVDAGETVGAVGQTGRASGCHLHFELWTAPGWYRGGEAVDPLPQLRGWEAAPHPHG